MTCGRESSLRKFTPTLILLPDIGMPHGTIETLPLLLFTLWLIQRANVSTGDFPKLLKLHVHSGTC
jgi:hypothetical protein